MFEKALKDLDGAANEAMLRELASPDLAASKRRRLAVLLGRLTEVPPPEPVGRWSRGSQEARQAMLDRWRVGLESAGRLVLPEDPDDENTEPEHESESDSGARDEGRGSDSFDDDGS